MRLYHFCQQYCLHKATCFCVLHFHCCQNTHLALCGIWGSALAHMDLGLQLNRHSGKYKLPTRLYILAFFDMTGIFMYKKIQVKGASQCIHKCVIWNHMKTLPTLPMVDESAVGTKKYKWRKKILFCGFYWQNCCFLTLRACVDW